MTKKAKTKNNTYPYPKRGVTYYTKERDKELWEIYTHKWYLYDTLIDGVWETINSPCSRMWVSEEYALRVVLWFEKHGFSDTFRGQKLRKEKLEMYRYIWRAYQDYRKTEWLGKKPAMYIVQSIVLQPAPKFFLSLEYAVKLIRKLRREHGKRIRAMYCEPLKPNENDNNKQQQGADAPRDKRTD